MKTDFLKPILIILILCVGAKTFLPKLFDRTVYKGPWYSVSIPEGWEVEKKEDEVLFISPDTDLFHDRPIAMFSIYTLKPDEKTALFLPDLFGEVIELLKMEKGRVMDHGEVKIDGVIAKWLLFFYEDYDLFALTFYMVDDWNRLTKIQFTTSPRFFGDYRKIFENFKDSFSFKKIL